MSYFSKKQGATLVELLVGILITAIVATSLLYFVAGAMGQAVSLQGRNTLISALGGWQDTLSSLRRTYPESRVIFDNGSNSGYDSVLFLRDENSGKKSSILMGIVVQNEGTSLYLDKPGSQGLYGKKLFAFLKIGDDLTNSLLTSTGPDREAILFGTSGSPGIDMKDALIIENIYPLVFHADSYNSGALIEANMVLTPIYFPARANDTLSALDIDTWPMTLDF